jgi:hypothetical protein
VIFNILYGYEDILDKQAYRLILEVIQQLELSFKRHSKAMSEYFILKDLSSRLFESNQVSEQKALQVLGALADLVQGSKDGSVFMFRVAKPILKQHRAIFPHFRAIVSQLSAKADCQEYLASELNLLVQEFWESFPQDQLVSLYQCSPSLLPCLPFVTKLLENYKVQDSALTALLALARGSPAAFRILEAVVEHAIYQIRSLAVLSAIMDGIENCPVTSHSQNYQLIGSVWKLADFIEKLEGESGPVTVLWNQVLFFLVKAAKVDDADARNSAFFTVMKLVGKHHARIPTESKSLLA